MGERELIQRKKTEPAAVTPSPLEVRAPVVPVAAPAAGEKTSGVSPEQSVEGEAKPVPETGAASGHDFSKLAILSPGGGSAGSGIPNAGGSAGNSEGDDAAVRGAPSQPGFPLPAQIRSEFEAPLGRDLGNVRLHTEGESATAAGRLGARAFTVGPDIHFAAEAYQPDSPAGRQLIAHEATHAVQQDLGRGLGRNSPLGIIDPSDVLEREARSAAVAMMREPGRLSFRRLDVSRGPVAVSRALAQDMEKEAEAEQKRTVAAPPPRIMEMSTINDAEQAQIQIRRIKEAQTHLFLKKAEHKHEKEEAGTSYKEKEEADHLIVQTDGFIKKDEEVVTTLEGIVNLSVGSSTAVKAAGPEKDVDATVGADMRLSAFANLYRNLERDFARLNGIVNAFLAKMPKAKDRAGNQGGADLGKAIATGGKDSKSLGDVHSSVEGAQRKDPMLMDLMSKFQTAMETFTKADFSHTVDTAIVTCGSKTNALRNTAADLKFDVQREDSPEEKAAKEKIAKINGELAEARKGLDKIVAVAKLAATVAGMPEVGALGEGSALQAPLKKLEETGIPKVAEKGPEAVKTLTDIDISDKIKEELTKIMTDFDARMTPALGQLEADQYLKGQFIQRLNKDKISQAQNELKIALGQLHDVVAKAEQQKKDIRDAAHKIAQYQAAHGGAKGGVDIAAMSEALGEVTIFLEQAKATKEQGEKEQVLSKEMIKRRQELTGQYDATDPTDPSNSDRLGLGTSRVAVAEKEKMYYDCEKGGEKYYLKMQPLRFELWSDKVKKTPDAAHSEVASIMKSIDEYVATAEGFKASLQTAMFGEG